MYPTNIITIFCEDIREEKNDSFTLVGIVSDSVNVRSKKDNNRNPIDGAHIKPLSKLCAYTRINFDPNRDIGEIHLRLVFPNDDVIDLGKIAAAFVKKSRDDAIKNGNPLAGVIGRAMVGDFQLPKLGILKLEVVIDGQVHLGGAINFLPAPDITSSTELSQLSSQSQNVP